MIIRSRPVRNFSVLPNAVLTDQRLSIDTRGMVAFILTKPPQWQIRPIPLARALSKNGEPLGRTRLSRMFKEAQDAGYMVRSEKQSHQDDGAFGSFDYVIGMPDDVAAEAEARSVASLAQSRDAHTGDTHTGGTHAGDAHTQNEQRSQKDSNLENIDSKKPLSKVFPHDAEAKQSGQQWTEFGQAALSQGCHPVYLGSKPFELWREFRGGDGMPPAVTEVIDGKSRLVVWLPSVYPPQPRRGQGE